MGQYGRPPLATAGFLVGNPLNGGPKLYYTIEWQENCQLTVKPERNFIQEPNNTITGIFRHRHYSTNIT